MILDLTILFAAFVIVLFILSIRWESTVLMAVGAAFSFIMAVMVRLTQFVYSFIDSADNVVTGSFIFDDVSATILFVILGIVFMVMFFAFRIQHSAEELQGGVKNE